MENFRKVPFQDLKDSNSGIEKELEEAAVRVIRSGWYLKGHETEEFEKELAASCGSRFAVATSNGLDALRMMIRAHIELGRLKEGDKILVPANTYIASILPLTEFGLVPVMVEPSEEDLNIDLRKALEKADKDTKGILLVHLYGNPAWDAEVMKEFASRGMVVMEDNAQAIGARANDKGLNGNDLTGNLGHCAAFSFYPGKNIGALGDAGAITTNDPLLADTIRSLGNYGSTRKYYNDYAGYNCRMDEIQAALLRTKLKGLEEISSRRMENALLYDQLIDNPVIRKPKIFNDRRQVWHQYVIRSQYRDELQQWLSDHGISTMIHYPIPPHLQKCYRGYWDKESLPFTEQLADEVLSIPIANVSEEDIRYVAEMLNKFEPREKYIK